MFVEMEINYQFSLLAHAHNKLNSGKPVEYTPYK